MQKPERSRALGNGRSGPGHSHWLSLSLEYEGASFPQPILWKLIQIPCILERAGNPGRCRDRSKVTQVNVWAPAQVPPRVPSAAHHPATLPLPTMTSRPAGKSNPSQLALHLYIPERWSLGMCGSPSPAAGYLGFRWSPVVEEGGRQREVKRRNERKKPKLGFARVGYPWMMLYILCVVTFQGFPLQVIISTD